MKSLTWRERAKNVMTEVRRTLFPRRPPCPGCQQPRARPPAALCAQCRDRIAPVIAPVCERCGRPLRGKGGTVCLACVESVRYFTVARAAAVYADAMRAYVRRFKYGGERELGQALGILLTAYVVQDPVLWPVDVVVPLPLHQHRLEQRGFNQAEVLARQLASGIGRRLCNDSLRRSKPTAKQSQMPGRARRDNVRGAFVVTQPTSVAGKRVLLVDDVLTSGATADEAAHTLLRAGAAKVNVACVAVAIHEFDWRQRHVTAREKLETREGQFAT